MGSEPNGTKLSRFKDKNGRSFFITTPPVIPDSRSDIRDQRHPGSSLSETN